MVTRGRAWSAVLGVLAVVLGVIVLRSPGAHTEVGWFSYGGPPAPELLDSLVAWNLVRAVGAFLVLLGLVVLAHLLGAVAARRGAGPPARLAGGVLVLAGVLVLGGLAGFVLLGAADRGEAVVSISKVAPPTPQVSYPSTVWSQGQAAAALVVATGLVLAAVGTGLRSRRT